MAALATLLCVFYLTSWSQCAAPLQGKVHPGGKLLSFQLGTPLQTTKLQLDVDADVTWIPSCGSASSKVSSTYKPIVCTSPNLCPSKKCSASGQCLQSISKASTVTLFQDSLGLFNSDASSQPVLVPNVTVGCQEKSNGRGIAAMSRSSLSLPFQIAGLAKLPPKFTLCLSENTMSRVFFGDENIVLGGINFTNSFSYIQFALNSFHPKQYYLPVEKVHIMNNNVELGASAAGTFAIDGKTGVGGIKFSSKEKYTKLASPVYVALRDAFAKYASILNFATLPPVGPLQFCFNASTMSGTRLGPVVPTVQLVMAGGTTWTMAGSSVAELFNGTACLAFIDAGPSPITSTIGLYQQFENLLHFDLNASRFGFIDLGLRSFRMNCRV